MSGPDDRAVMVEQGRKRLLQHVMDVDRPGRANQQRCDVRNQIVSLQVVALLPCLECGPLRYHHRALREAARQHHP